MGKRWMEGINERRNRRFGGDEGGGDREKRQPSEREILRKGGG